MKNDLKTTIEIFEKHEDFKRQSAIIYIEGDRNNAALVLKDKHGVEMIDVAIELYKGGLNLKIQSPNLGNDTVVHRLMDEIPEHCKFPAATLFIATHYHRHGTETYTFWYPTPSEPPVDGQPWDIMPTEDEVVKGLNIDFEPNREEYIEITLADSAIPMIPRTK